MPKPLPIPAGTIFTLTTGAYSDYSIDGVFRALLDINTVSLARLWLDAHPDQKRPYSFKSREFFAWVCAKGYCEQISAWDWHLGDYSNANEMSVLSSHD